MDFKVGDIVKLINTRKEYQEMYKPYLGQIGKIESIVDRMDGNGSFAEIKWNKEELNDTRVTPYLFNLKVLYSTSWANRKNPLENIRVDCSKSAFKKFTLKDLKERYLLVFRNGKLGIITRLCDRNHHVEFDVIENGEIVDKSQFNYKQDLTTFGERKYRKWDIMAVEKPKYEQIWARPVEYKSYYNQPHSWTRVCTLKELEKELGYKIELW